MTFSGAMPHRRYLYLAAAIVLVALGMRFPALLFDFAGDDYAQVAMVDGTFPVSRPAWSLFTFSGGEPTEVAELRREGYLPWWSADDVRLSVLRPLPSLLIWLDRTTFGDSSLPYHLHSLVWWLCLCAAVAKLLHALLPSRVALTALAVFTFDSLHSAVLGWLANRNAILASLFAVMALLSLVSFRRGRRRRDALFSAAWFALALSCGEYALTFIGYFAALVLIDTEDPLRDRMWRLLPVALPAVAYVGLRTALGAGTRGSGTALDPMDQPLEFVRALPERAGALWAELMFEVPVDFWASVSVSLLQTVLLLAGVGAIALLALTAKLGARESGKELRALPAAMLVGALWATIPVSATLPAGRHLLAAQLGVATVVAIFLARVHRVVTDRLSGEKKAPLMAVVGMSALALWLVGTQLLVAPARSYVEASVLADYSESSRASVLSLGGLERSSPDQRVYIVRASDPTFMLYPSLIRSQHGRPRHAGQPPIYTLSGSPHPIVVKRDGPKSLLLSAPQGGGLLTGLFERMFRSDAAPFRSGDGVALSGLHVEVVEVDDGRPARVRFLFEKDLDDPSMVLLLQVGAELITWAPPAIGRSSIVSAQPSLVPGTEQHYRRLKEPSSEGLGVFYMGREIAQPVDHRGAAWLERGEREAEEQPGVLLDHLGLKPGMTVADIGAGTGYISWRIAKRIAPNGVVLAVDVDPKSLEILRARMKAEGVGNVRPILGSVTDPRLEPGSVDLALMVDVYHEMSKPHEMLAAIAESLKPDGRVVLVEYRGEDEASTVRPLHKMTRAQVKKEAIVHRLVWRRTLDVLPTQHVLFFARN